MANQEQAIRQQLGELLVDAVPESVLDVYSLFADELEPKGATARIRLRGEEDDALQSSGSYWVYVEFSLGPQTWIGFDALVATRKICRAVPAPNVVEDFYSEVAGLTRNRYVAVLDPNVVEDFYCVLRSGEDRAVTRLQGNAFCSDGVIGWLHTALSQLGV